MISQKEKEILRALAQKQLEHAHSEKNLERVKQWYLHNDLKGQSPIIHIELDTFEHELITPLLRCESKEARRLERDLYSAFYNLTEFDDDWVIPDYFGVETDTYFHLFGHDPEMINAHENGENTLGYKFEYVITDLEDDWDKLGQTVYGINEGSAESCIALAEDAFGDILPVRKTMASLGAVPTQQIVRLAGMENMCYSLCDYPELFEKMMSRVADDYLAFFSFLEKGGHLLPTNGFERLNQGSKCFTSHLPSNGSLTLMDVWGFMDSQESVSISPDMFEEFIFPCYKRISSVFGLLSYGCCEPVDTVWNCVKTLPNLRKVSVSPWCNEEKISEELRGSNIIYHRKPSPNFLGIGAELDESAFREHIRKTIKAAQGCKLEITQRDVYTVNSNAAKVRKYVQIIREEIASHYKP